MAIEIPRTLVEFILLGPEDDRRQLQDSPILGDVWIEFARTPGNRLELLITPHKEHAAPRVASALEEALEKSGAAPDADIAYLQGIIAARLSFEEVIRCVVPMTYWWNDKRMAAAIASYRSAPGSMAKDVGAILDEARNWLDKRSRIRMQDVEARKRYIALAGLILWAEAQDSAQFATAPSSEEKIRGILGADIAGQVAAALKRVFDRLEGPTDGGLVWTISLNRRAIPALKRSVPAVKADAARTLFTVDCSQITWAVIDSGIDATHPAFADARGAGSRVKKSFDFTTIRDIVSLDNLRNDAKRRRRVAELLARPLKSPPTAKQAEDWLKELAGGAQKGRSIDWEIVERLVEIDPGTPTLSNHGTHVAGIIGADKKAALQPARIATAKQADKSGKAGAKRPAGRAVAARAVASRAKTAIVSDIATQPEQLEAADADASDCADGMCPDIRLYDFRVLAPTLAQTEFSVIAALQYIRYVNERNSYITIHGANLSLSIPHDVRNYACGRTPVCNECERLVASGVVVVVAAGNRGYQHFETKEGLYESYAAFSITDPGNADGVITVGATHRFWPHTYGVSFFSSRGPTGDGRMKPDLVAPGERIRAPLPDNQWGDLDGTSMAAPHVSGAAAMLMARYSELIGEPRRVKQILCQSATDLARERSFQGHGMLDVLRAFQSI
ncbi:MAG TPA: S8 family serine peptidase [Burkholderiales bacterium]|jgi:hypothetical protein